jgi:uncharacterized membrane protein YphA (DoxX/SURF4 family)
MNPTDLGGWQLRLYPVAIALLRVTFGLLFLTNGISKIPGFEDINYLPFPGFLIDYDGARNSLDFDTRDHPIGPYRTLVEEVVLDSYTLFGVGLVAAELAMGLMLITGAFASLGALLGSGALLHLWFANWGRYHSQEIWAWEGPIEWLPLLALTFLAAGRCYGLDRLTESRLPARFRRWPLVR